jgi:WD40 repeat protein
LVFSADGKQIFWGVSRSEQGEPGASRSTGEIHAWSSTDGTPQPGFKTEEDLPGGSMLAISSDRSTLVSAHFDKTIIWDVTSRQPRHVIRGLRDSFGPRTHGLAISPYGKIVASKSGHMGKQKIYLWNATTGEPILPKEDTHSASVLGAAYSPDGKFIATSSADNSVHLWNAATGEHIRKIDQGTGWVRYVEFFPDGERIALGREAQPGFVGEVKICRVSDGHVLHHFHAPDRVMCGALSADGKLLAVGIGLGSSEGRGRPGREDGVGLDIFVWDTDRGQEIAKFSAGNSQYLQLSFSPQGDELWALSEGGHVRRHNPRTGEEMPIPNLAGSANALQSIRQAVFVPASSSVVLVNSVYTRGEGLRSSLMMRPLSGGTQRWQNELGGRRVTTIGASPDGKLIVTQLQATEGASMDDRIVVWTAEDGQELMSFSTGDNRARSFAFSPDGRSLISGMELGDTLVWDISSSRSTGAR